MKLAFVDMCGFRGFRKPLRINFSKTFTVIDGRNGVGKSTIFDAVEFALTGTISKYLDATAARESVDDYLWWSGEGDVQEDHYVEVGFDDGEKRYSIRRTPLNTTSIDISQVVRELVDLELAPKSAITQLCAASIIRDEHIARLSLDLKEVERFTLLRDAIGATDAGDWINKASRLVDAAGTRVKDAEKELDQAKTALINSSKQFDQVRFELSGTTVLDSAVERLQSLLDTTALSDELGDIARRRIVEVGTNLELVQSLLEQLPEMDRLKASIPELERQVKVADTACVTAKEDLGRHIASVGVKLESTALSIQASQLESLVNLGSAIGTRDGHCPLCESEISEAKFKHGLDAALVIARQLDAETVEQARKERACDEAKIRIRDAELALNAANENRRKALSRIDDFESSLEVADLAGTTFVDLTNHVKRLETEHETIADNLRKFDTSTLEKMLEKVTTDDQGAKERQVKRAKARLGQAQLAERRAKAVHNAVRRTVAETLDQRLERVLPLMSELYKRLRPHPLWKEIEYSVRGDVQRFLKLQVGGNVNPQFVFSSGQRRVTGLAFLLSINLSIAWSRWRSILLDDPVQHIDDFRTVHLAEVLAHICHSGRQIVCAVEDSALAELMCRRLSTSNQATGKRVTLGNELDGSLSVIKDRDIPALHHRSLVLPQNS